MIVSVPQEIFSVAEAIEKAANGGEPLGIRFDTDLWCWTLCNATGEIFAKLSAEKFGVPPEVQA